MTDPLVQRVLDLADESLLIRDCSAELDAAIDDVERAAAAQVVRDDNETARPLFEESLRRARDPLTQSYALRHIAFCDDAAGDAETAERRHEAALELRRRVGWQAGIAAQLAAVADHRARRGDRERAAELAQEARAILVGLGAERALALFGPELDALERG